MSVSPTSSRQRPQASEPKTKEATRAQENTPVLSEEALLAVAKVELLAVCWMPEGSLPSKKLAPQMFWTLFFSPLSKSGKALLARFHASFVQLVQVVFCGRLREPPPMTVLAKSSIPEMDNVPVVVWILVKV